MADPVNTEGLMSQISMGKMGNQTNLSVDTRPVFTPDDNMMSMSAKLNQIKDRVHPQTARALVVEIEDQEEGGVLESLFSLFGGTAAKKVSKLAYVYIDRLHAPLRPFINVTTIKAILLEVPIYGDDPVSIGMLIEVALDPGNLNTGKYIKKVVTNTPNSGLTAEALIASLCASPSMTPHTPAPSSTPNNFGKENVGYLQALYVLAKWQADNPFAAVITEITFPFMGGGLVPTAVGNMIAMAKKTNAKILKNKSQDANPAKQWVSYMTRLLDSAVKYKDVPLDSDGRMIVKLSSLDTAHLRKIDSFTSYSTAAVPNDKNAFYMSFPKGNKKIPTSGELLTMTEQNLGTFLENFEKTSVGQIQPATPAPAQSPTLSGLAICGETMLYANAPSDIEGVPFADAGFQSKRKRRRKTKLIVVHHSVTSTASKTNATLRDRGLSVHFGVDRGKRAGVVEQHLPINIVAAHGGRLNNYSVSVENTNPTGFWGGSYKPDASSKGYEALYQLLLKLTKKLGIPFRIHEAHVVPGSFAFGKLEKNQHTTPGIMAHGSDLGTTHLDGAFELLYSQLRYKGQTEIKAYKNAVTMLNQAKKQKKSKKLTNAKDGTPASYPYATLKLMS